jgi:hypothetical protein
MTEERERALRAYRCHQNLRGKKRYTTNNKISIQIIYQKY